MKCIQSELVVFLKTAYNFKNVSPIKVNLWKYKRFSGCRIYWNYFNYMLYVLERFEKVHMLSEVFSFIFFLHKKILLINFCMVFAVSFCKTNLLQLTMYIRCPVLPHIWLETRVKKILVPELLYFWLKLFDNRINVVQILHRTSP